MTDAQKLKQVNESLKKKFKDKKLVLGRGAVGATVVLVGEAPGPAEEKEGKPIAGNSARLLNQLLRTAGLSTGKVYVTNIMKYARNGAVAPTPKEIKSHATFLREEIKTIGPRLVVTLGNLALNGVGMRQPLDNVHGRVFSLGNHELLATFHPEQALNDPQIRILLEADFIKLKDLLNPKGQ